MKHTLMYFKVIIFILLCIIILLGWGCGVILLIVGLFSAFATNSTHALLMVPVGLFCGLMGFVAFDALEYINDKWEWHK
jgi:hypothetical protein